MSETRNRILIVDDKASIRTTMSLVLGEIGYLVRSANDGLSALREIRRESPEILLSDLNMPGMSGFELLRAVRRQFPTILVIAMSGAFSGNEVPSGVAADAFYQKGSSTNALLQILRTPPQMNRPALQPCRASAPLWIQRNGNESSGNAQVTITCPECLRTFPQVVESPGCAACEVDCIHCGTSIQFEVVEPTDRMPQQVFRRGTGTAFAAQSASVLSN
jgi:CheY-like chemotaxis protein